tara:strand:+ start:600 stop:839 length:240 start_codon:yes stop_codon:yes gene_type:complete
MNTLQISIEEKDGVFYIMMEAFDEGKPHANISGERHGASRRYELNTIKDAESVRSAIIFAHNESERLNPGKTGRTAISV